MDIHDRTRLRLNNKIKDRSMGKSDKAFLGLAIAPFLIWAYFLICWLVNLVILLKCDFEGPWREEIIHAIGLIGPAAGVTVWM